MKRIIINDPPNPDDLKYRNNQLAFNRSMGEWMQRTKGRIEQASRQNDTPLSTPFTLGSFTTNTVINGTTTGTDLTNFVCTMVEAMLNRGFISTTTSTGE